MRIVWKNFPLEMHKDALPAALAAMAANEQGRFYEFHDKVFASQPKIQRDFLLKYAKDVGLDVKRFQESFDSGKYKGAIDADMAEARAIGVTGTPSFFINGRFLSGAKPFDEFAKVIDAELARKGIPSPNPLSPPPGAPPPQPVPLAR